MPPQGRSRRAPIQVSNKPNPAGVFFGSFLTNLANSMIFQQDQVALAEQAAAEQKKKDEAAQATGTAGMFEAIAGASDAELEAQANQSRIMGFNDPGLGPARAAQGERNVVKRHGEGTTAFAGAQERIRNGETIEEVMASMPDMFGGLGGKREQGEAIKSLQQTAVGARASEADAEALAQAKEKRAINVDLRGGREAVRADTRLGLAEDTGERGALATQIAQAREARSAEADEVSLQINRLKLLALGEEDDESPDKAKVGDALSVLRFVTTFGDDARNIVNAMNDENRRALASDLKFDLGEGTFGFGAEDPRFDLLVNALRDQMLEDAGITEKMLGAAREVTLNALEEALQQEQPGGDETEPPPGADASVSDDEPLTEAELQHLADNPNKAFEADLSPEETARIKEIRAGGG